MSDIKDEENVKDIPSSGQMVTFTLGKETFGLTTEYLQEIVRLPNIIRAPNVVKSITGIGNLRGDILPFVDLRNRLGMSEVDHDKLTRILVLNFSDTLVGLIVDSVLEVISFEKETLSAPPVGLISVDSQFLKGVIQTKEDEKLILVLEEKEILPEIDMNVLNETVKGSNEVVQVNENLVESQQVIALKVDGEEYAIDINKVKEIIRYREMTPVPNSADYVLGLVSIRGQLLPIMDLRKIFSMPSKNELEEEETKDNLTEHTSDQTKKVIDLRRIVIVDMDGKSTGFLVDSVSRVLRIENKDISEPPSLITKTNGSNLTGVAKLDNGKRIVMLLNVDNLVDLTELTDLADEENELAQAKSKKEARHIDTSEAIQLVCFKVKEEEYAVNIMKVQEIIRLNDITNVPHSKTYMKGIINLRGIITPIIDMRSRFSYEENEHSSHTRIVVVQINEKPVGLIVDSVTEVLRTTGNVFEKTPSTVDNTNDSFIESIGKLNEGKRIVALIDEEKMMSDEIEESLREHTSAELEDEMSQAS